MSHRRAQTLRRQKHSWSKGEDREVGGGEKHYYGRGGTCAYQRAANAGRGGRNEELNGLFIVANKSIPYHGAIPRKPLGGEKDHHPAAWN